MRSPSESTTCDRRTSYCARFSSQRRAASQRQGNILILAAFLMLIMLGMVAFSVDVGYIATVKTELQAAADSAALAAAANLAAAPERVIEEAQKYGRGEDV